MTESKQFIFKKYICVVAFCDSSHIHEEIFFSFQIFISAAFPVLYLSCFHTVIAFSSVPTFKDTFFCFRSHFKMLFSLFVCLFFSLSTFALTTELLSFLVVFKRTLMYKQLSYQHG